MEFLALGVIAIFVLAYALVSKRLETTFLTGPILFVAFGMVAAQLGLDLGEGGMEQGVVRLLAEATLVLLLFTDAIRIDFNRLRRQAALPVRLLGLGMPLTLVAGLLVALALFPDLEFWEAALVAAILTPTDAALGQAVVSNRRVPVRVRQALNVESGLNDGIMLPVITLFLALAATEAQLDTTGYWLGFAARQIGYGVLIGVGVGYLGGRLLDRFAARGWVEGTFRQLGTLAIGVGAFALASLVDGNGFVAAFVAGLAFGAAAREHCADAYDFAEDEGQLLSLLTFLFFGGLIALPALELFTWQIGLYAVLSLTVVRMVPVALSMVGSRLRLPTVLFFGWFGPRGLASILFGLLVLEEADIAGAEEVFLVVTWTVLLSVLVHGVTSFRLSERYGAWFALHGIPSMQEAVEVEEMPTR